MGSFFEIFSLRNLLLLSVALNASLVLRVLYQEEEDFPVINTLPMDTETEPSVAGHGMPSEAQATQRTHLSLLSSSPSLLNRNDGDRIINLQQGDPTMYERFWQQAGEKSTIVIPGWQSMSYFSDAGNLCWFLEPEFAKQILRLHKLVGNAVVEDRHIVVGTGSTQLFQSVLYALSPQDATEPLSVVSAAPYYSAYPSITDCLKSGLYKWAGDARSLNTEGAFIEVVTSPSNPDGYARQSVVNRSGGILVHDLAYYWPQYTPMSAAADHDIMLFTASKSIGHAGMRIGWALVKDEEVAKKMVKFIELNTLGVSKDSQLRAAKVLQVVSDEGSLFQFASHRMEERWRSLRSAVKQNGVFTLPEYPPSPCSFHNRLFAPQPAFAWLKCKQPVEDCQGLLRSKKILGKNGKDFGVNPQYVRVSMLDRDDNFDLFVERLSTIHLQASLHTIKLNSSSCSIHKTI